MAVGTSGWPEQASDTIRSKHPYRRAEKPPRLTFHRREGQTEDDQHDFLPGGERGCLDAIVPGELRFDLRALVGNEVP